LTYYGLLAQKRLAQIDKQAAAEAANAALKPIPGTSILSENAAALKTPALARALTLLRLGLHSFARREFAGLGLADSGVPREAWLLSLLYDRVGEPVRSYKMARSRVTDTLVNPPAGPYLERWKLAYPRPRIYGAAVTRAAKRNQIDEALIWAIMRHESAFRASAVSVATAVGLLQLIIPTATNMARIEGVEGPINRRTLQQPELNIRLGARFLGRLSHRFDKHPALIAAGYNAGPGRPLKWLKWPHNNELDLFVERIPFREARRYTKSVVTSYLRYRYLYGGGRTHAVALRLPSVE
jgi:soluble lytic murein transglycosylase